MFDFLATIATFKGISASSPDYLRSGVSLMLGANPDAGDVYLGQVGKELKVSRYAGQSLTENMVNSGKIRGTNFSTFGSQSARISQGGKFGITSGIESLGIAGKNPAGALLGSGMSLLGIGLSGYFAYQGYQEDGISGAANALVYDAAVMSATMDSMVTQKNIIVNSASLTETQRKMIRAGSGLEEGAKISGKHAFTRTSMKGFGSMIGGGLRAGIGASLGQAIGGTPGAFAGAFLGAKAGGVIGNTIALGGVAAIAAVANVGSRVISSGTQMVQKGYQRRVMSRRIDTAGDTAAFFTRNANTMRQRSVMAMRNSHLNARSALGMEASMAMTRRGYF